MEEAPITRAFLESLTTYDLIKMADDLGVDMPPDLDRVFVIEEILEISAADKEQVNSAGDGVENETENGFIDTVLVESAPLPKQYNITFIEVMIRDPLWAFVFWEIKTQDKEQIEKSQDFEGYYLKVSPFTAGNTGDFSQAEVKAFKIPVKPEDTAWYLGLSPAMFGEISQTEQNQFTVEFCADIKGEEIVLVTSNPVKLPDMPQVAGEYEANPLACLSGFTDFHIIRNNERLQRQKKVITSHE